MNAIRNRRRTEARLIREEALRLAAAMSQRQDDVCLVATRNHEAKMSWLIENLLSSFPIFIISASWLAHAGEGVFVSSWYRFAPDGLVLPMFGYLNSTLYSALDCRQGYQGETNTPGITFHGIRATNRIRFVPEMIGNYVNRPAFADELWTNIGRADIEEPTRSWYLKSNVSYIKGSPGGLPYVKLNKGDVPSGRELYYCYNVIRKHSDNPACFIDCLNKDVDVLRGLVDGVSLYPKLCSCNQPLSSLILL